jgi:hypothetical protein
MVALSGLYAVRIIGMISRLQVNSVETALMAKAPPRQVISSHWPPHDKPPLWVGWILPAQFCENVARVPQPCAMFLFKTTISLDLVWHEMGIIFVIMFREIVAQINGRGDSLRWPRDTLYPLKRRSLGRYSSLAD